MEYSKEDLMEAKKQIWGVGENMGTEESKKIWEENAQFWDNAMGDESNEFHREVVRPNQPKHKSPPNGLTDFLRGFTSRKAGSQGEYVNDPAFDDYTSIFCLVH